jgi:hypothetical protein
MDQLDVGPSAVALRPDPAHDPGLFQHSQVMREQVARQPESSGQFTG